MAKRVWKVLHNGRVKRWDASKKPPWYLAPPHWFRLKYLKPNRQDTRVKLADGRWDEVVPANHHHCAERDWW